METRTSFCRRAARHAPGPATLEPGRAHVAEHTAKPASEALRAGFSLLESVFALAVLATISLLLVGMIAAAQQFTNVNRERAIAQDALRGYVETMRGVSLTAIELD